MADEPRDESDKLASEAGAIDQKTLPSLAEEVARITQPVPVSELPPTNDALDDDLEEFGPEYSQTDLRKIRAVRAYVRTGKVKDACAAAGVRSDYWAKWIRSDPQFARLVDRAKWILANDLEETGMQRAKDGSDTLLMFFLKALNPKYRDKQTIEVVSPDVQSRLARQAEAILEVCRDQIEDVELRATVVNALANRFREIWV